MNLVISGIAVRGVIATGVLSVAIWTLSAQAPVPAGKWGGAGIDVTIAATGARIQYDCAVGTVDEPIVPDRSGAFVVRGTYALGHGGPRSPGQPPPKANAARYEGTVKDDVMQLKVSLPERRQTVGEFTVKRGQRARLDRCG